jgi:hypothetical protein
MTDLIMHPQGEPWVCLGCSGDTVQAARARHLEAAHRAAGLENIVRTAQPSLRGLDLAFVVATELWQCRETQNLRVDIIYQ